MSNSHRPNVVVTILCVGAVLLPTVMMAVWLTTCYGDESGFAFTYASSPATSSVYYSQWKTFNWHPMLMTFSYCTMLGLAAISFKRLPFSHNTNKYIHFGLQTIAVICSSIAIAVVYNMKLYSMDGKLPNMYTAHAWVGWTTYVLYCLQYLLGAATFLLPPPFPPVAWRKVIHPFHICVGCLLIMMTTVSIVSGIVDRYWMFSVGTTTFPMPSAAPYGMTTMFGSVTAVTIFVYLTAILSQHVGKKGGYQLHHQEDHHDKGVVNHAGARESDVLKPLLDHDDVDDFLDFDGLDH